MIWRAVIALLVALAMIAAALLGAVQALGAHPWWDVSVAATGAGIGAIIAVAFGRPGGMWLAWAGLIVTLVAFATARHGMTEFAASFGEDAFAGRLWFFGWIAACACAVTGTAGAAIALHGTR